MAAIDFARLLLVTLLCFITAVISYVNAGPDVTSSAPSLPNSDSPLSLTVKHSLGNTLGDKKASKNLASTSVMAEGGPIPVSTAIQHTNIETTTGSDISDVSKVRENVPRERNAAPSVVARKGVEEKKVKPRKGVNQTSLDTEPAAISFSQTTPEDIKPIAESISATAAAHANNQPEISNVDSTPKLNAADPRSNDSLSHGANSSLSLASANVTTTAANNTIMPKSSSHVQKHIPKPKPTVTTVGGAEINESRLPLRSKSPPLGMPRKIDYIVPVMITIIALPLLGSVIFILYRRGRDCWDKRHYRRMDFLIDGMYND